MRRCANCDCSCEYDRLACLQHEADISHRDAHQRLIDEAYERANANANDQREHDDSGLL